MLQGNILEDELESSSETEGRFLSFRSRLKPIAFASKSLSDAETRYSNIERELLGVVWAVEHYNHFTFAQQDQYNLRSQTTTSPLLWQVTSKL